MSQEDLDCCFDHLEEPTADHEVDSTLIPAPIHLVHPDINFILKLNYLPQNEQEDSSVYCICSCKNFTKDNCDYRTKEEQAW